MPLRTVSQIQSHAVAKTSTVDFCALQLSHVSSCVARFIEIYIIILSSGFYFFPAL